MRLASRLVRPPHAAHPPRCLHPALRSRCAPCSRSSYDCAEKGHKLNSRWLEGKVYPHEIGIQKTPPNIVNLTVKRRYLTEREVERLMNCARKHGRYGHRDTTMILVAYRHGLRASEACDLQWQQIQLSEGRCTFTVSRTGLSAYIRSAVMRCARCASYAAITPPTPTCSFPSAAAHPAPRGGRQDAIPNPSAHASPCLRVQARQRWPPPCARPAPRGRTLLTPGVTAWHFCH
jgi:integrase